MKTLAKKVFRILSTLLVLPYYLAFVLLSLCFSDRVIFPLFSQYISIMPGIIGDYLRYAFYQLSLDKVGDDVVISFGVIFSTSKVSIGSHVYIGPYSIIGESEIGANSIIASRVSLVSGLNQHSISNVDVPIRDQKVTYSKVYIGEDVWIGEGALVGANVSRGSVVGMGSVVVKDVDEHLVVAGNPASLIRKRKELV